MRVSKAKLRSLLVAAVCAAAPAVPAGAALTHRYSFNDGTANDSITTAPAHGTLEQGATVTGGSLVLANGTNTTDVTQGDYVNLPNNIAQTPAATFEFWTTWNGGNAWQRVFDFGINNAGEQNPGSTTTGYNGTDYIFYSPNNSNNVTQVEIKIGGNSDTANPPTLTSGVERHVTVTMNSATDTLTVYVEGVQVAQNTTADVDLNLISQVNSWLGRSNWQADPFYNGSINEFRIFDNVLPADAVAFNQAQGPNGIVAVPEPSSAAALALGALALLRRRPSGRREDATE